MAQFIMRVDFPTLKSKNFYERASIAVHKMGFRPEAVINKLTVQLPMSEFYIEGDYTTSQVIDAAKEAMLYLDEEYSLLVIEVKNLDGYNLMPNFNYMPKGFK